MSSLPFLLAADVVRPVWSMDFDDMVSLVAAIGAVALVFVGKRTSSRTSSKSMALVETVDANVLGQFKDVLERVAELEIQLTETQAALSEALAQLEQMEKLEEYLQGKLHEKEEEIRELRANEQILRERIRVLEEVNELA